MYYTNRRKAKRKEFLKDLVAMVLFVIIMGGVTVGLLKHNTSKDEYYYTSNGKGSYVQLVDRPCIVTEVDGVRVTVETINGGELYDFYGDGYKVGAEIICTFTMTDELIKAEGR